MNCAYMSPLAHQVSNAMTEGIARKKHPWTYRPEDFFAVTEEFRSLSARICGAQSDEIAIVPAVSYGIATIMQNLPVSKNRKIIVLKDEFPSTWLGWRDAGANLEFVGEMGCNWTDRLLESIDGDTAIVVAPQCHWSDGGLIDLETVGSACREVEAELILDLTQSLGVIPFDVSKIRPAFMMAATYKWLLGPYGAAMFYVDPRFHDGEPIERNWMNRRGSEDFSRLTEYQREYQNGARRFDMGEKANPPILQGASAALKLLLDWKVESIQETLLAQSSAIAKEIRLDSNAQPISHIISLKYPQECAAALAQQLADRQIHISVRGSLLRVSPHLWTTQNDIARFIDTVKSCDVLPVGAGR